MTPVEWQAHFRARHPLRLRQRVPRRWPLDGDALARLGPALVAVVVAGWVLGQCAASLAY